MKEYKFNVELYNVKDVIKDHNLDKLCPTSTIKENIAITISKMYFYQGMIKTSDPKLPAHILKCYYREIIIDALGVIETIEYEVGAKLLGINRKKYNKLTDKICYSATSVISGITSGSKNNEIYDEYKEIRHKLHISSGEQIEEDENYSLEEANKWATFMRDYIFYLNEKYELYIDGKGSKDLKDRINLLKGELNY